MRRFIACLVVACALTFGLAPAAFADEALGDVDSPRATASAGSEGQDVRAWRCRAKATRLWPTGRVSR